MNSDQLATALRRVYLPLGPVLVEISRSLIVKLPLTRVIRTAKAFANAPGLQVVHQMSKLVSQSKKWIASYPEDRDEKLDLAIFVAIRE